MYILSYYEQYICEFQNREKYRAHWLAAGCEPVQELWTLIKQAWQDTKFSHELRKTCEVATYGLTFIFLEEKLENFFSRIIQVERKEFM